MPLMGISDFWNAQIVWESQTVNWENGGGWSTEEILSGLLDTTTTLQDLRISTNTLQGLNNTTPGIVALRDNSSTLQGIA
tara:strand:- start:368 stop:607 length:240 start_codon:yes stop_codon:yes gene_type:complete